MNFGLLLVGLLEVTMFSKLVIKIILINVRLFYVHFSFIFGLFYALLGIYRGERNVFALGVEREQWYGPISLLIIPLGSLV